MNEEDKKRDLTGALRALEQNNALPPEEKQKREFYAKEEAKEAHESLIQPLRTYESDAAEFIKQQNQSLYSISQAEKNKNIKQNAQQKKSDPEKAEIRKNGLLLILSGTLFLAGLAFVLYFILIKIFLPSSNTPVTSEIKSIIPSQYENVLSDLPESKGSILQAIKKDLLENPRKTGEIENIEITKTGQNIDISTILLDISENIPAALLRSFNANDYMVGAIQKETKKPFFILKINFYDNAFASMLEWEKNLNGFFLNIGIGNATQNSFTDTIIKNKDARILKDESGKAQVVYTFFDKETLIVAPDEEVLTAVATLLKTSSLVR